jgi:hemoglobin-like flavoprotein
VTPEQVALVQGSFAELGPRTRDLAARFYELLFEADPSLRSMFSSDPVVQESLFTSELAVIVRSIPDFGAFVARTRRLGRRHARYGVTYAHYEIAGRALLSALEDTLGSAFTDEMSDAWRLGFDLVAETMMQGATEAAP